MISTFRTLAKDEIERSKSCLEGDQVVSTELQYIRKHLIKSSQHITY